MATSKMLDPDTLWNQIYFALEKEWPDAHKSKIEGATERICEEVADWFPEHGDFWLSEDGVLYVNKGWQVVTAEAFEVTPEENERRFQEAMKLIKGITHEQLVDLMGEEWLAEFRKVAQ